MPMIRVSDEIKEKIDYIAKTTHRSQIGVVGLLLENYEKEESE